MNDELKELLRKYLIAECGTPDPTDQDIKDQYEAGTDHFGTEENLTTALKEYFGGF